MQNLLRYLPSIKTLLILAGLCAIIVYGFKDVILAALEADDNGALPLILAFLIFFLIITLGIAGFYAITKTEVEATAERTNVARVKGSKGVTGKQKGTGGYLDVEDSEDVNLEQDNTDNKKKAP